MSERDRLKELERAIAKGRWKSRFCGSVLREGSPVTSKYQFIETMRFDTVEYACPVEFMCDIFGASKQRVLSELG